METSPHRTAPLPGVFRLLVRAAHKDRSDEPSIEFGHSRWVAVRHDRVPPVGEAPEYTCVSYSWGAGRRANPFDPEHPMSDRAVRAVEATIEAVDPAAIWFDAFCVPGDEPQRALCLRSMGAIYAAASRVIAVLTPSTMNVFEAIRDGRAIASDQLRALESDDWVSRAWTYQEMVNSREFLFVSEEGGRPPVSADAVLNSVGAAIEEYRRSNGLDPFRFREAHPRLDHLESLIADWLQADYGERSALLVMSTMANRSSVDSDDKFHAMVGALSTDAPWDSDAGALSAAEYFMRVCERKGDYSFVFSSAERALEAVQRWRPPPGPLPAIVWWPPDGAGQLGEARGAVLRLSDMHHATRGSPNAAACAFIDRWLAAVGATASPEDRPHAVLAQLARAGFSGRGEWIELEEGYFFPQHRTNGAEELDVVLATRVTWRFGAPGLLAHRASQDADTFRDVGVFAGVVPTSGESVDLR
jgi:Heterokaryon incompatibility protein (HET)